MVIRNQTEYPTDEVRKLVKFGAGRVSLSDVLVIVKYTKDPNRYRFSGMAYSYVNAQPRPKSCRYQITLRLGSPELIEALADETWKRYWHAGVQFPEMEARTWQETLVLISAHEAKHIDQYRTRREFYSHKPRGGRSSEVACEHYAKFRVGEFRKLA